MNATHAQLRLAPITSGLIRSNPKVLLGGALHQPSLLRYLDGWPRRNSRSRCWCSSPVPMSRWRFADDSFDLAVIQSPSPDNLDECIRELTCVARQGLITRR